MICPKCKSEYQESITRCAECETDLVPELPPEVELELTPVLRSNSQPLITMFTASLTAAEIPHIVRGDEATSLIATNSTVVVPREHVEAARAILKEAESAPDDIEEDGTGEEDETR